MVIEQKVKKEIICTLGPASMNERTIVRLEELGVSLFRINLSHTKLKDISRIISFIRNKSSVPVCLDTEGAQIRTGNFEDKGLILFEESIVCVPRRIVKGNSSIFNLYPRDIIDKLEIGDFVSIGFNSILAQVIDRNSDRVKMRILVGGLIEQNKAVTVDRDIPMPPLTEKDYQALAIGAEMGVQYIALSFSSQASDVDEIRRISAKNAFVISKIESVKGLINLEEIVAKSDALLLDRGDLSREVPMERIPLIQKDVIRQAKKAKKKIFIATNLLESMVASLAPTRAEINDIFNSLDDGADGLVLAAETAIGFYPVNCARMVSKVIKQFLNHSGGYTREELQEKNSFLSVEPHGGVLVNRIRHGLDIEEIKEYKILIVDRNTLSDVEQIALGTFSPIEGFMNKKEVTSVLDDYCLPNGIVWPLPIILQITEEEATKFKIGDKITLALEDASIVYAILHLEDIYSYDLDYMAKRIFGTNDDNHIGVQLLKKRGGVFLGGKIDLIKRLPSETKCFEMTPRQVRNIFRNKGWSKVAGFHTRNVIHRVHEYLQLLAFEKYYCDGLFIHPAIGHKKSGDYSADIILKSYKLMMDKFYPKGKVVLAAFQTYSRYAGPREAVFTALCRKNFGCSHFIVGRDHAGFRDYYKFNEAHKLFDYLGDLGITPVFFNEIHYCGKCKAYVENCKHGNKYRVKINGTESRRIINSKKFLPEWFMRKDISRLVLDEITKGSEVFVK